MGLEMELDYEKNGKMGMSPNTVLPSMQNPSYTKKRIAKARSARKDELLVLKKDFREISFSRYRSISCKNVPSRHVTQECNVEFRRGSMYQSSREVRRMKEMGASEEGRKKIEISQSRDITISIFDTLCWSDVEKLRRRYPKGSFNLSSNPRSVAKSCVETCLSDGFFEICLDPGSRGNNSAETRSGNSVDSNFRSDPVVSPLTDSNELLERDAKKALHKPVSAKEEIPSSSSINGSDCSSKASSKTRFIPIRKVFDPFVKSKTLRNPLSHAVEPCQIKATGLTDMSQNKTCPKSLLNESSERAQDSGCESQLLKSKNQSFLSSSPVHLHGYLKLENKHGLPFIEFSSQRPEDVFIVKTWKAKGGFNWVYTFHCIDSGKKSNASRSGLFDSDKDFSMVGQMQVSCYLCSELNDGIFDNSMVTEFVLYDISHARSSVSSQENSKCTADNVKSSGETFGSDERIQTGVAKLHQRANSNDGEFDSSDSYPWAAASLHPNLEIAAIVTQAPFEKRESLKHKRGDNESRDRTLKSLLNLSTIESKKLNPADIRTNTMDNVKVVIPAGNHGLPSSESGTVSPSSLLDRWRSGGGCDCGGWDMACPLTVLGNPQFQYANSKSIMENQMPTELFVQGTKDITPALTMTVVEEGLYAVDFHARLSTLQAFSVCVAILHRTETSPDSGEEALIGKEAKLLTEAVTAEKKNIAKRVKEIPPSRVLNPPFSPIARV